MSVSRLVQVLLVLTGLLVLWGCSRATQYSPGPVIRAPRMPEAWRRTEESKCLAMGLARPSPFLAERSSLGGSGMCGVAHPFEMSAALNGQVTLRPTAMLRCEMIPAVDRWLSTVVQPAARRNFGMHVVEIKVASSYSCRPMNNVSGSKLSEHGHANALDVSAFMIADGRWITVKQGWWGDPRERAFLRQVHDGGCSIFTTVLGPMANRYHRDHFHYDLAWHGRDGRTKICR